MNVNVENIALGGVDHIDIDGTDYPISDSGCVIECNADIAVVPVVGRPEPRVIVRGMHFVVSVWMLENTLEMLELAWHMTGHVSYSYSGLYNQLYLGIPTVPTAHAVTVRGWGRLGNGETERKWREFYFRKAISYELGEQDLGVGNTVYVPVKFYCYADSTQVSGEEFGWVREVI